MNTSLTKIALSISVFVYNADYTHDDEKVKMTEMKSSKDAG